MNLYSCKKCKERQHGTPIMGEGLTQSVYCILGRNGGIYEGKRQRPWVGPAGKKLRVGLSMAHILIWQCYFTNVVKCPTPPGVGPAKECYETCRETWLDRELIKLTSLRVVLCFGKQALYYFCPQERLEHVHGRLLRTIRPWAQDKEITIFSTLHPTQALRDDSANITFESDMIQLSSLLKA